ncbi:MAG: hypothetical protein GX780_05440 [Campylobacteraceae bacterium]|nr:hypothetical protein [Campylobacteraceae bacterium]
MNDLELKNIISIDEKKYLVSTIATQVRHAWFNDDEHKIVYETMVFELDEEKVAHDKPVFNERYHTAEEAIAEHGAIIESPEAYFIR